MDDSFDGEEQIKSRPYQTQLEEIAMAKNTIIHLPTGSGKTFIAIRVINRYRQDLRKPWGEGGKRTFFLVNTIPLVLQQKKVIESLSPVQGVAGYSGEDGVDFWDKHKWDAELAKYQVIVITSQILADMLTHNYIKIEDINLLIFDECHHAVVDHPMRLVMKHFESCPTDQQPRVLGLTATLLNSNVTIGKVEETLRELETTFHSTIATVNELGEVLNYSTNPNEVIVYFSPPVLTSKAEEATALLTELQDLVMSVLLPKPHGNPDIKLETWQKDITCDPKKIVKEVKNMIVSMIMFIEEFGVYGGALGILAYIILMERLKRKAITVEEERMYKVAITHSVQARMILLNSMQNETGYKKIVKHSSVKILELLSVLKEYSPAVYNKPGVLLKINKARKPLSGIIFTKQRFTAKVLYNLLREVKETNPEEFSFLKHDFIVGFNINPYKSTREQFYTKKSSQTALLKFSNKELNCLISTSVIEEGVDIPQCLLVLRYDPPLEYRSYIQSKGRARSANSTYVILMNKSNESKFKKQYLGFQSTERYIQRMLVGSTDYRDGPSQEDIQDGLYDEGEIAPYVTKHGARLSAVSAISLLNRYCSVLPHDQFTIITPMWIQERIEDQRKGRLRLIKIYMPIACPVKEMIAGEPMQQLKAAKRVAALKACIRLHLEGELDDVTLLPRRYGTVDFEQPEVKQCFPNWPWDEVVDEKEDVPKPGTKSRMRKHPRVFPSYLQGPKIWTSDTQTFYLHVINLKTVFEEPKDSRERALYDLLQRNEGFGFLTSQPLPKLCDFPMFLTVGEVTTSLEVNCGVINLTPPLFDLVKRFHFFIFDQVLEVSKKFTVFDGSTNAMYVVPIKSSIGYDIDWDIMMTYEEIKPVAEPSNDERKSLQVSPESYRYHVVSPWYRGNILPARYIVSNVIEYMTPNSLFDSDSDCYGNYADYYLNKYNLEVLGDKDQPLLEVRNISTRMNCLMPRAATINAFSDKQQKLISLAQGDDKPKGFPEVFIPEFCIKYDFPGVLWYKAILLPSIVHRVFMLLVSHELRAQIAKNTDYGHPHIKRGDHWAPIDVNLQVAIKSMLSQVEEPTPINTIDRINNPIDDEAPRPLNIISMRESLYQLQKKKISQEYPWDEKIEPIDIERNMMTVTVMDIECYDEFVSATMSPPSEMETVRTPPRLSSPAAILPPPVVYNDKIAILTQTLNNRGPELKDVLAAITTINSHDTFNLERAETLGDSFLKFAASLYLYHKFPKLNEGQLTNIKCRLIGNRNLFYAGKKVQLGGLMKVEQFSPRKDFLVPGFFAPKDLQEFIETKQDVASSNSTQPMMENQETKIENQENPRPYLISSNTDRENCDSARHVISEARPAEIHSTRTIISRNSSAANSLAWTLPTSPEQEETVRTTPKGNKSRTAKHKISPPPQQPAKRKDAISPGTTCFIDTFTSMDDEESSGMETDDRTPDEQPSVSYPQIRPTFLIGLQFSQEEALSGQLSTESLELVRYRCAESDGTAEREPVGGAQTAMQCYVRAQTVSDKSVADCVEALVGTYLLSGGILAGVKVLEWLKVLPPQDQFAKLLYKNVPTILKEKKETEEEINRIMNYCREDIEEIIRYKFKDPSFLLEALSHPSYIRNRLTRSYERLEFLGDAILDFLITAHVFEQCRDLKPGELTDLRSALVNNVTFASYVVKLGLHKYVCYQLNPALESAIVKFIDHQDRRGHSIVEDVLYLIDEEDCHIAEYVEVPKVLSDIFESLAGAIYLDSGGDLQAVWSVYYRIMCKEILAFSHCIPLQPVRVLHEKIHACPMFGQPQIPDTEIPKVMVPVTVTKNGRQHTVHGFGGNKFQAKRAAAKLALKILAL